MKKYAFSAVMTFLLITALVLCIVLFQRKTKTENGAYLTWETERVYEQ